MKNLSARVRIRTSETDWFWVDQLAVVPEGLVVGDVIDARNFHRFFHGKLGEHPSIKHWRVVEVRRNPVRLLSFVEWPTNIPLEDYDSSDYGQDYFTEYGPVL